MGDGDERHPGARTRALPPRDARDRFVARPSGVPKAPLMRSDLPREDRGRVRALPSRDARGRFVAFPTMSASSSYVLCADAYRIPGEAEVMAMRVSAPPARPPDPEPRRSGMTDNETKYPCYRLCRAAGLPERGWHILRHGFGSAPMRRCSA